MEEVVEKKKSKGQIFKEEKGFSKTQMRLMHEHDTDLLGLKRRIKERKKQEAAKRRDKRAISRVTRKSKKK